MKEKKMPKNKKNIYGLILIGIGIFLIIFVGSPLLFNFFAIGFGLYLINYGLLVQGKLPLMHYVQKVLEEIRIRFF